MIAVRKIWQERKEQMFLHTRKTDLNLRGNGRDNVASDSLGAVERLKRLNAKDK